MDQSCAEADGGGAGGDGTVLSCFKQGHEEDPSAAIHKGRSCQLDLGQGIISFVYWSRNVPSFPFFDLNFQEVHIT